MKARRANVTGSHLQVYSSPKLTDAIVKAIQAGHVSAIGSTNINTNLVYIINPRVHINLEGKPINIVGNASDPKNKFLLVRVSIQSLGYFIVIGEQTGLPAEMIGAKAINEDCIAETSFTGTTVKAALMPNWVCFHFGGPLVYGELREEECMLKIEGLGPGYCTWANAVV